ncbi:very long-chain acyl-CoA synthetase [Elysia marginata]|uniref:long-chain-fatty-acid--CoA ligase n=1 Tax=Elysia marginata TaxID=1093978 RepID=A0AAV4FVQ4_9GAST|nr:very long-chain acyl-CoA synthetase [Elysia marginata]
MKWYQKAIAGSACATGAGLLAWKTMFPWLEYDVQLIKVGKRISSLRDEAIKTFLIDKFEEKVATIPKKAFIIFEDNVFTYEFMDQMACKVANIAKSWGLKKGDCVAIMIENEPSFVWTFLGLQKLGVAVAFINFNLKMHPLVHSVLAADPKYLIVGSGDQIIHSVLEVLDDLGKLPVYVQGHGSSPPPHGLQSFDALMDHALPTPIVPSMRAGLTLGDTCCYIYTSGTTGNPKAVCVTQWKACSARIVVQFSDFSHSDILYTSLPLYHSSGTGVGVFGTIDQGNPKPVMIQQAKACAFGKTLAVCDFCVKDILYTVLPLYHSSGGGIGLCSAISSGATMVLRRKFSARNFIEDCRKYNVTVIQYIGELFRYLLAQPASPLDSQHSIRAAFGNGLRKDIWLDVMKRFKIPRVVEFFGATEGTTMLVNVSGRPGAIGRLSPLINAVDPEPKALVKFDYQTAEPVRDKNGHCIKVGIGEPGLFISTVPEIMKKDGNLKVYRSSDEANEKKLVRNAFVPGDLYFNYGDVFVVDSDYFLYFQDRIGDTFRWKGENVSTTELANVISNLPFIEDANVYGVAIPGSDGRAGMAAITVSPGARITEKEMKELYDHVVEELPSYAQPLFIRHLTQAVLTGTFKQRKVELVKEAYDISLVKDPLFFLDHKKQTYSPLREQDLGTFLSSKL